MQHKYDILSDKSFQFSVKIYELYRILIDEKREFDLGRQLLKSGTAIGANIEEAIGSRSKKEFVSKVAVAYNEARETMYWLRLLYNIKLLEESSFQKYQNDCEELLKISGKIISTTKSNLNLKS